MMISELKIYNFRQFESNGNDPGLHITFHKGLNALIGENDSGKTAVIDALKLVLLTQSNEYIRPVDEDFCKPEGCDEPISEFKIDCTITDFSENEAKNFVEYLSFKKEKDEVTFFLQLHYRAWKEGHKIFQELRVGDVDDGISIDGKARDLLKAVYLKPLRDAEREMSSGRSSRISQILLSHPVFQNKKDHKVVEIMQNANSEIEDYFSKDEDGKHILQTIRDNLLEFNDKSKVVNAELKTSDIQLKAILESLALKVSEINPGLGELNLLFMAAELLLLKDDSDGGLKLALIEELEAHLHPQAQLRLISYLQNEYCDNNVQIIISTHSPILASKINLKNLILMKNGKGYDLAEGKTGLEKGDYLFLQRFLDSTKANIFFAKGIIMVEGAAENILIPVIADIIDLPLEKYGVSIVNVGSTAFLRYSRIMLRKDGDSINIPVSVVTDCDVKPSFDKPETYEVELEKAIKNKEKKYSKDNVRGFISPRWTLEYCIAMSCLSNDLHRAIYYGKEIFKAKEEVYLDEERVEDFNELIKKDEEDWKDLTKEGTAYKIYNLMLGKNGKSVLKSIVAQCLAALLRYRISAIPEEFKQANMFDLDLYGFKIDKQEKDKLKDDIEKDQYLSYIVQAIKYAAGKSV